MRRLAPLARRLCLITSGGVIGKNWQEIHGARHAQALALLCLTASRVCLVGGLSVCTRSRAWAYGVPAVHPAWHDALTLRQTLPELRRALLRHGRGRADVHAGRLVRLARLFAKQAAFIRLEENK